MTQTIINDIPPYTQGIAAGGQTVFGTNWTANAEADVVVFVTPLGDDADDATQMLAYPSQYTVNFIGALLQAQVTLVTPLNLGDRITIIRMTPADRENLYSNTNFTPSMLNNDFGILTLVDQQNQLVNQAIAPRYNYSAIIQPNIDTILPILAPNQIWIKNTDDTAIIPVTVTGSGEVPSIDTFILATPDNVNLPNAFALNSLPNGILINNPSNDILLTTIVTGSANQIEITNGDGVVGDINVAIASNPIIPGTAGMGIPQGTTAQRVIPSTGIGLRYNTDLQDLEYWNGSSWFQLSDTLTPAINKINTQIFISSGTYIPSSGMQYCTVELQAAGGAGGGSPIPAASENSAGSGGASGSYSKSTFPAVTIGASQIITLGSPGIGVSGTIGNNGGNASFGVLLTAYGGSGGNVGISGLAIIVSGGDGPLPGNGDIANGGQSGTFSVIVASGQGHSGAGGSTIYGSGGEGISTTSHGNIGTGYGSGGGGSQSFNAGSAFAGGNGAVGICIITEYISN